VLVLAGFSVLVALVCAAPVDMLGDLSSLPPGLVQVKWPARMRPQSWATAHVLAGPTSAISAVELFIALHQAAHQLRSSGWLSCCATLTLNDQHAVVIVLAVFLLIGGRFDQPWARTLAAGQLESDGAGTLYRTFRGLIFAGQVGWPCLAACPDCGLRLWPIPYGVLLRRVGSPTCSSMPAPHDRPGMCLCFSSDPERA